MSTFEEVQSGVNTAREIHRPRGVEVTSSRTAIMLVTAALASSAIASPLAAAQTHDVKFELESGTLNIKGKVEKGVFKGIVNLGRGFFEKGTTFSFEVKLNEAEGKELEEKEIELEVTVEKAAGDFKVSFEGEFSAQLTENLLTALAKEIKRIVKNVQSATSGTRKNVTRVVFAPAQVSLRAALAESLHPTHSPGTFYAEDSTKRKFVGPDFPSGFDIPPNTPFTFTVTGPAKIHFQAYPIVQADQKKRTPTPFTVIVAMDGQVIHDTGPTYDPDAGIAESSKAGGWALSDTPIRVPTFKVPAGTHQVQVNVSGASMRVVLFGTHETTMPDVQAAADVEFEEDPDMPPALEFPCTVDAQGEFKAITPNPVPNLEPNVLHIPNSPNSLVKLTRGQVGQTGFVSYLLTAQLAPGPEAKACEFQRTNPPSASTDFSGPNSFPLHLNPDGTIDPNGPQPPGTLKCETRAVKAHPNRQHIFCSDTRGAKTQAYRTTMLGGAGKLQRHSMHRY